MDLSKLSDADLLALKSGKLSNVSTAGLLALKEASGQPTQEVEPEPSFADKAARTAGLGARAVIKGVTAIPALMAEGVAAPLRAITGGRYFRSPSAVLDETLTQAGLPEPQNATERVTQDVVGAMTGQGALVGAGRAMANVSSPVARRVIELMTAAPGSQIVGAGAAGASAGAARESGAGPVGQTVAALAGGVVAPISADAAMTAGKALWRGAKATAQGFTKEGQKRMVGTTLNRLATDPKTAAARMEDASEIVPGSLPTAAQAASDEGLLIAERGLAAANPKAASLLSRRASAQNTARNILLNEMAGDEAAIAAAQESRAAATAPLRESALKNANIVGVSTQKILRQLRGVESQPGIRASDVISKSLSEVKDKIAALTNDDGFINAKDLYTIRKELGNVIKKNAQETQNWDRRLTAGLQDQVQGYIDDAIESAGGKGWKQYLATYAEKSKPINQMETLQALRDRVLNAGTDANTGERILSQAKFSNAVNNQSSAAELRKILTPEQFNSLKQISADLDRSALSATSGRGAGSNTTQNLSTAYVIGQALGGNAPQSPFLQNLMRPLAWLNKLNEQQIQELMVDAMLDPGLAKSLMARASPRVAESLGYELKKKALAKGYGATIGATGNLASPPSGAATDTQR